MRSQARVHLPAEGEGPPAHRAVVVLQGADGTRVVFSARPPGATLAAGWADVAAVLETEPARRFARIDRLAIPRVALRVQRSFDALVGATIAGNPDARLAVAQETVALTLDERGAEVDAEATLIAVGAVPLVLELDRAFLVALLAP